MHNRTATLRSQLMNTYSIIAHDSATGQLGVAVQTHQVGVGRMVPWLKPGVGAIATQSLANISYGPRGLALLEQGQTPQQVVEALTTSDAQAFHRQLGVVRADGKAAAFTGELCIRQAGHHVGEGYTIHANMMANGGVISAMRQAYETATGDLVDKLMAALYAAEGEGGDIRGMQSAALVIVPPSGEDWATIYDLRVDEHATPLDELARLVRLRKAALLSNAGDAAFHSGNKAQALDLWEQARRLTPEQEELAFWQAMTLADEGNDVATAAAIFNATFQNRQDREQWLQLIVRLEESRLIQRVGAASELIDALK